MKTYKNFVKDIICDKEVGRPIYLSDVAEEIMREYRISLTNAQAAASVAIKRILDNNEVPNLRIFQKGIYYLTKETAFGEIRIDKDAIIRNKYMKDDNGYEYGSYALYILGLTTQLPNQREIVSNNAYECRRKDRKLEVWVKPPKTPIDSNNIDYLMILDVIDVVDKYPVDMEEPYNYLAKLIDKKGLRYNILLAIADKYYNINTIKKLAQVAGESEVNNEAA